MEPRDLLRRRREHCSRAMARAVCAAALAVGCGGAEPPTYHREIRPILEVHCTRCHGPGGTAPFSLARWDDVEPQAAAVVLAVESGAMPLHVPRDGCRPYDGIPVVPESAVASLVAWRAAGFPEGDPASYRAPPPIVDPRPALGEPTSVIAMDAAYQPAAGDDDQSTEWLLSERFAEDTWIVATEIRPLAPQVVHHAIAYLELGTEPPTGAAPIASNIVGAWAPGYAPLRLPEGSALFVPAGAGVKLLVHYSTIGLAPGEPVPADRSELRLWTLPAGERPRYQAFFDAISASDLLVPAGVARVEIDGERALGHPGAPIVGVVPHMHLLGVAFRSSILRSDGTTECLVDLPSYDFAHQSLLLFAPGHEAAVGEGDVHRMTCIYDNSPENQPEIGGAVGDPVDVRWGDASTDEMCTDALLRIAPLTP